MSDRQRQLFFTYFTFMLSGMLALSVGSLMPYIRDARGIDYALAGLMVSLHSMGNLAAGFLSGAFAVKLGRRRTILLFNACYFLAYFLIAFGGNQYLLMLAFLLTGFARGASSNFNNATINHIDPGNAVLMNILHAVFSIGAFLFPILLMLATSRNSNHWIYVVWFMIVMGLFPG